MRVLVKFDNSAKPQPIAGPLATSCGAGSKPLRGAMEINELFATAIALRQILPPG